MATIFHYYCRDCDKESDEGVTRGYVAILQEAYEVWPHIAEIKKTAWITADVMGSFKCYSYAYFSFLADHYGHRLVLVDEYGKRDGRQEIELVKS